MKLCTTSLAAGLLLALVTSTAVAQNTVYWDINGTDPGAGNIGGFTDGVWGTDSYWNPMADGTGATGAWVAGDNAVFSAGSDAVDSFIDITGTQVANSLLIEEGTVFIASGVADTGANTVTINSGATLRINSTLRLNAGGKVVLNGGTLMQTNPGQAGSFISALKTLEVNGTGYINYTSLNNDNTPGTGTVSIYTPTAGTATILGTGGTTANGGAGTLVKRGIHEFRYNGAGTANTTFAKLVVEQGLYRLGSVIVSSVQQTSELGFGAAPLAPLADAITLDGGSIGLSFSTTLHANRGITITSNGGTFFGSGGGVMTVPGSITGSNGLTVAAGGGLIMNNLNNSNTFSGKLTVSGGTIGAPADSAFGAVPVSVVADHFTLGSATTTGTILGNATFELNANRGITLTGNGQLNALQVATITYNGIIAGTGNLTKTGLGTWVLGGDNTFVGTTTSFGGGVLSISSDSNLGAVPGAPVANGITLAGATTGGTLRASATMALDVNRGITLNNGGADPVVGAGGSLDADAGVVFTVPGVITSTGRLKKTGLGTVVLTGENTNSGIVSVNAGTLLVNNTSGSGTGTGAVEVNTGGILGGTGSIAGVVTVNTGGHVAPGTSIESLDVGGLIVNTGSILDMELGAAGNPGTSDLINVINDGGLTLNGGTVKLTTAGGVGLGSYNLIDYAGTLGGALANLALDTAALPAEFAYALSDAGGLIKLDVTAAAATLVGDYNNDGFVNAADYTVWRDNLGSPTLDNNRDPANVGAVAIGDYNSWYANFGGSLGSGGGQNVAIPEPTSLALAGLALLGVFAFRRRTR